jgi:hypothetical protein
VKEVLSLHGLNEKEEGVGSQYPLQEHTSNNWKASHWLCVALEKGKKKNNVYLSLPFSQDLKKAKSHKSSDLLGSNFS